MLFRNLTLFRVTPSAFPAQADLEAALEAHALRPVGALEMETFGWVPVRENEAAYTLKHPTTPLLLLRLGQEQKVLPGAVVTAYLAERLRDYEAEHGRRPGGKLRRKMREELLTEELLPRALVRPRRTWVYLNPVTGWVGVDTASRKVAETVVGHLREALDSFPAVPVEVDAGSPPVSYCLTQYLREDRALGPHGQLFSLGDECELHESADGGGVIRFTKHDLTGDEIREHLQSGKQVHRLGVTFDHRVSVVLGADMVLRKLRALYWFDEREPPEDAASELTQSFMLTVLEVERLLGVLSTAFNLKGVPE